MQINLGGKKMKKLFALLLALAMITCLFAGCKGNEEPTTPNNSGEPSSESTPVRKQHRYREGFRLLPELQAGV